MTDQIAGKEVSIDKIEVGLDMNHDTNRIIGEVIVEENVENYGRQNSRGKLQKQLQKMTVMVEVGTGPERREIIFQKL